MADEIATELTGVDKYAYDRAKAKIEDPAAKPLTQKEHGVYDRVHGDGSSVRAVAASTMPAADLRDAALAGMSAEQREVVAREEEQIALEAQRPLPTEDVALFDRRSPRGGMTVPVDAYSMDERGGVVEDVARDRRAQHSDELLSPQRHREGALWTNPAPADLARPTAPLPGDADRPSGAIVDDRRTSARPRMDSSELVQEADSMDQLLGSSARRSQVSFDTIRDAGTGFRLVFSRHYHAIGVLVDLFSGTGTRVDQEVGEKIRAVTAYNAACADVRERMGYLPIVAGVDLTYDDVAPVLRREIVAKMFRPETKNGGEQLDPTVIYNLSPAQFAVPKGSARVGEKPFPLSDGRSPMAAYFHEAMSGVHTVVVDGVQGIGQSRELAEANARALIEASVPA